MAVLDFGAQYWAASLHGTESGALRWIGMKRMTASLQYSCDCIKSAGVATSSNGYVTSCKYTTSQVVEWLTR